jgi:3-deoxy-7-phosphoheptulonate synthase
VIITHALRKPVVRIGRIAGQYAKPRSGEWENERERIPVYRGDLINGFGLDERTPDPARLKQGYFYAAASLNYIRAMIDGGFADLHHPYNWNLHAMEQAAKWDEYRDVVERILDAIHFMESFGGLNAEKLHKVDFYISHEALHLGYEESMARPAGDSRDYYNQGAHMVWIGERTRFLNSAHIEYCRGIANPVGIKVGPDADRKETAEIVKTLNPREEPGKLCIVTRLGAGRAEAVLPGLIEAVRESGVPVAWICDPMHGNTTLTKENIKTRNFKDILSEIRETFAVHRECGTIPAGLHFELTGYNVTECTGGAVGLSDEDLGMNYQSFCDPRLNYTQSMEMAFLVSSLMRE